MSNRPLIALMGPTATGKTRLAIELARALDGEVISVDSGQVYRSMDIGTAKPDAGERAGIPHHLIDILDPAESYSTGRFRHDALALVAAIRQRGRTPILSGGTLLYFHGLLHGLAELPGPDPALRQALDAEARQHGWARLHAELARVDPVAAARIHPNDPQRIQRALEVYRGTGQPLSHWQARTVAAPLPGRCVCIALAPRERAALAERIERRFHAMLRQGLIEEVEALRSRGDLRPELPALRAVGYRQVWAYLDGEGDHATMVERALAATRQLAKRQLTWLNQFGEATRLDMEAPDLVAGVLARLEAPQAGASGAT